MTKVDDIELKSLNFFFKEACKQFNNSLRYFNNMRGRDELDVHFNYNGQGGILEI